MSKAAYAVSIVGLAGTLALTVSCSTGYRVDPSFYGSVSREEAEPSLSPEAVRAPVPSPHMPSPRPKPSAGAPFLGDLPALGRLFAAETEEVLVIEKRDVAGSDSGEIAQMKAKPDGEEKEMPLPLKHTDVAAQISAFVATVEVTQEYHNPFDKKIEAVYVFPLPENAAVTDFVMVIGERRIRGIIREREEARRIYEHARQQGHRASLLTQERPNIFTQRVANIEPGNDIDVRITYFNTLQQRDGEYEFVFPTVVGPRFNPPGSTNGVGAVAHGSTGRSGQSTEVEYLRPGAFSSHDVSLSVDIQAGLPIRELRCPTHVVNIDRTSDTSALVTLAPNDRIPNRDIVLRYRLADDKPQIALLTHREGNDAAFALVIEPPATGKKLPRAPREMVFVLDCSGSMSGVPIAKAKDAMRRCLASLDGDDTFQIIRFSSNASALGDKPVPATKANIRRGLRYIEELRGSGGTMMIEGIKAALDFPHDAGRVRIVTFMTDGYIGNEAEILAATHERLGASRIFSFGVGSSVNRYLLSSLARFGQGKAMFVTLDEGADKAVDSFYGTAAHPALRDIRIDWGGMEAFDVYPRRIPHLYVGEPVVLVGRYRGELPGSIRVTGLLGDEEVSFDVKTTDSVTQEHPGIAKVWARRRLGAMADNEIITQSDELRPAMIETSIDHSVLCDYTAFVAVDSLEKTEGDHGFTVNVPVPVPHGVRYETTVKE